MKMFIRAMLLVLTVVCMGCIFVFSSQNAEKSNSISKSVTQKITETVDTHENKEASAQTVAKFNLIVRKYAHFMLFFTLGAFSSAFGCAVFKRKRTAVIFSLVLCLAWAVLDEVHQLYVPGRTGKAIDVMIDFAGSLPAAVIVVAIAAAVGRKRKKKVIE